MFLKTAIKTLVALENAPKVKGLLKEKEGACYRHRGYCTCDENELCNVALAEYLGVKPPTAWRLWNNLMEDLEEIGAVETRLSPKFLKGELPPYRPHRFIRLTKSVDEILDELQENAQWELEKALKEEK